VIEKVRIRGWWVDAGFVVMIGRRLFPTLHKYGPYTLAFLLGYALKCLDTPSEHHNHISPNSDQLQLPPSSSLMVLVMSAPANSEVRDVIRKTWLSVPKKDHSFEALFVLGKSDLNSTELQKIEIEKKRHDDILILPLFDSYETLTNKVLESIVFVQTRYRFNFLLKCDDDSFVDIVKVVQELQVGGHFGQEEGLEKAEHGWRPGKPSPSLYWGFFDGRAYVRTTGKFPDPKYKLCDRYIPYALGGGYVLGRALVDFITTNANQLEQFFSEDASVGAWLAGTNAVRRHDTRFDTQWKSRGCSNTYLVTHKQTAEDMEEKWETLVRTGTICDVDETRVMLSYKYDWSKPPSMCCVRNDWSVP